MPRSCAAALAIASLTLLTGASAGAAPAQSGRCDFPAGPAETVGSLRREGGLLVLVDGRVVRLAGLDAASLRLPASLEGLPGPWNMVVVAAADRHGILPVWLADQAGSLAERLVEAGAARVRPRPGEPACFQTLLVEEARARQASLGLWRDPGYAVADASDGVAVGRLLGRFSILQGRVRHVGTSRELIFVDFGPVWRTDVTLIVPARDQARFFAAGLDIQRLTGRPVRVRGVVTERGGPALLVSEPAAIELLDDVAPAAP